MQPDEIIDQHHERQDIMFRLAVIFAALMVTACTSSNLISQDSAFSPSDGGMILFQLTNVPDGGLTIAAVDLDRDRFLGKYSGVIFESAFNLKKPEEVNNYYTLKLSPGWYAFSSVSQTNGIRTDITCLSRRTVVFEVLPGSVSYVGDYDYLGGIEYRSMNLPKAQSYLQNFPKITAPVVKAKTYSASFTTPGGPSKGCASTDSMLSFSSVPLR